MIVLDASVMIAFLAVEDPHHEGARCVFSSDEDFGVHMITLAEALVRGEREGRADELAATFTTLGVRELPRQPGEARSLARLHVSSGL